LTSAGACVPGCDAVKEWFDGVGTCGECHALCSRDSPGCTGPAPEDCFVCGGRLTPNMTCVDAAACPVGTYPDGIDICRKCHPECRAGQCHGGLPDQCDAGCASVSLGETCMAACPAMMYPDPTSKTCLSCDDSCYAGCDGPGPSRCTAATTLDRRCKQVERAGTCVDSCPAAENETITVTAGFPICTKCSVHCLGSCDGPQADQCHDCRATLLRGSCVASCPADHFVMQHTSSFARECSRCHPECVSAAPVVMETNGTVISITEPQRCTGEGNSNCVACLHFSREGRCVDTCDPTSEFVSGNECLRCDEQCIGGCGGPDPTQCAQCRGWQDGVTGTCIKACPLTSRFADEAAMLCLPCSEVCSPSGDCSGPSAADCGVCLHVRQTDGTCVESCDDNEFVASTDKGLVCQSCHTSCKRGSSCLGAEPEDCNACDTLGLYSQTSVLPPPSPAPTELWCCISWVEWQAGV
jgi:proprotein convertase subtilisin/kexin type 5